MRGVRFFLPLFVGFTLPSTGQDNYPRGEVFGGYAYSRYTFGNLGNNLNGVGMDVSGNFTKNLGVTAQSSILLGTGRYFGPCTRPIPPGCPPLTENLSVYYSLVGPRFTWRTPRVAPFAEALFGIAIHEGKRTHGYSDFAMGFGGVSTSRSGDALRIEFSRLTTSRPNAHPHLDLPDGIPTSGCKPGSFSPLVGRNVRSDAANLSS